MDLPLIIIIILSVHIILPNVRNLHLVSAMDPHVNPILQTFPQTSLTRPGDLTIGGLFEIYSFPEEGIDSLCSKGLNYYYVTKALSLVYGVELLNDDFAKDGINLTFGYTIQPTCAVTATTQMQGINMRRGSDCLIAVIGPFSSSEASVVAPYFSFWNVPVLSPKANSFLFMDKMYRHLFRFLPDQTYFLAVLVKLIRHFDWTYVSMVYSDDEYNAFYANKFRHALDSLYTCLRIDIMIPFRSTHRDFKNGPNAEKFRALVAPDQAPVTILFLNKHQFMQFFRHIKSLDPDPRLLFVTMDTWPNESDLRKEELISIAAGTITLLGFSGGNQDFRDWLNDPSAKHPASEWFSFWSNYTFYSSLSFGGRDVPRADDTVISSNGTTNGSSTMTSGSRGDDSSLPMILDIVAYVGKVVRALIDGNCSYARHRPKILRKCICRHSLSPYFRSIDYSGRTGQIDFSSGQSAVRSIEIANFIQLQAGRQVQGGKIVKVGAYDPWDEKFNWTQPLRWRNYTYTGASDGPVSRCSVPCEARQVEIPTEKVCCWRCETCEALEYKTGQLIIPCAPCPPFMESDAQKGTTCVPIPIIDIGDGIVGLTTAVHLIAGTCIVVFAITVVLYFKHYHSMVFRLDVRPLIYYIFSGILLGYIGVMQLVSSPNKTLCGSSQFMILLSFALLFSGLFGKLSLARDKLNTSKHGHNMMIIERRAIYRTLTKVVIQVIINMFVIVFEEPGPALYQTKIIRASVVSQGYNKTEGEHPLTVWTVQRYCAIVPQSPYLMAMVLAYQIFILFQTVYLYLQLLQLRFRSLETSVLTTVLIISTTLYVVGLFSNVLVPSPILALAVYLTIYLTILTLVMVSIIYYKKRNMEATVASPSPPVAALR